MLITRFYHKIVKAKSCLRFLPFFSSFFSSFAQGAQGANDKALPIHQVAANIAMGPVAVFLNFFYTACYITGAILLINGYAKFRHFRRNPQEMPLSTSLVYIILGIALMLIPFIQYIKI